MNKPRLIRQSVAFVIMAASAIIFTASLLTGTGTEDPEAAAADFGKKTGARVKILDKYIEKALNGDPRTWMELDGLPEDMVVYRYVEDTLQSWAGQFPLRNDDIRAQQLSSRLSDARSNVTSPLASATSQLSFVNHGPKWYLEKAVEGDGCKVIAGLEIVNQLRPGSLTGVNPRLRKDDHYGVSPLSSSSGTAVSVGGVPLFKLTSDTAQGYSKRHSALIWLAMFLFMGALIVFLSARPTPLCLLGTVAIQTGIFIWMFIYGRGLDQVSQIFSPLLYADGPFLYSLGAVMIVNLAIDILALDLFVVRWTFLKRVLRRSSKAVQGILAAVLLVAVIGVGAYLHIAFCSILENSSINLELYKVTLITPFTGVVYVSFLALALAIPMLLQILAPLVKNLTGFRYDMFSLWGRMAFCAVLGAYLVVTSAILGFRKEQRRVDVWANRLAMDRDVALEIQLRSVEGAISEDSMIGALAALEGGTDILRGRLTSAYMVRIAQDYDISVVKPGPAGPGAHPLFLERIRAGVRLGENSHFFYSSIGNGRTAYTGLFTYYSEYGPSSIFVTVESKHNREDRGYLSLLGIQDPGRVSLPPVYSWAKYIDGHLLQYKGAYPFPTLYSGKIKEMAGEHPHSHIRIEGWDLFTREVSDGEVIILARQSTEILHYIVEGFLLTLAAFFLETALSRRRRRTGSRSYFQTRISLVVYISLIITLVAMAVFSVWFVGKRNVADMQSVMTSRINTLQAMLQERLRQVESTADIGSPQAVAAVEGVGNSLRCDITIFDTAGSEVMSTTPEVYDRMILGNRMEPSAYNHIIYGHDRFYLHPEKVGRRRFYALYVPLFNSSGTMIGIASAPFTDLTHNFETEAVLHVATIITIFLLLLLITRFITYVVVSRLFRPLTEMSRKMTVTDVDHLEPLIYHQDDELTPLVDAYNRMVKDLGESSRRLAQAERDKAWTDMARRVAHDLKNPLTPIKLQLQMLIRLKSNGNPAWQDKFDEVAQTVLYHVDLLSDSADQFSTFAKMYDQKAERIDLDALVRQEVELFDSRDDIQVEYYGLAGAMVNAPRPQLTRVVVNLITNAIQAVDGIEGEKRLLVSLRNSSTDGFYEIVVEDNGPGVEEANQEKIFTPDFTTKTSGSGLGLAICRRIVEHCGGSISYSRSFALGGACFTVKYPRS
ncbi:MAG: GHKL domain-containing protein [Bacteroidales bacterium]|nr:GHKL domain-containing protein [Bacteroidales bacterium]